MDADGIHALTLLFDEQPQQLRVLCRGHVEQAGVFSSADARGSRVAIGRISRGHVQFEVAPAVQRVASNVGRHPS